MARAKPQPADLRSIRIRGAREHNLKGVDVTIPRDCLVVMTGVSGSGKSSLAFDTIFAEGQRKYMESLSAYARQFLDQMQKPDVDSIEGLPPTIAIEQRGGGHTPRSTVATTTEIYDYLRLMFARCGTPTCWHADEKGRICGKPIRATAPTQIVDAILATEGARLMLCAPVVRGRSTSRSAPPSTPRPPATSAPWTSRRPTSPPPRGSSPPPSLAGQLPGL